MHEGTYIKLTIFFSAETLQASRECNDMFKVLKGKTPHPRVVYSVRLPFRMRAEIENFSDKQKLKEFIKLN